MVIYMLLISGNGDDNLILGLCVDNVSVHGKVRVEEKELSPSCALFYVTLEGMLAIHYFARYIFMVFFFPQYEHHEVSLCLSGNFEYIDH